MIKQLRSLLIFWGLVLLSGASFAQVPLAGYIRTLGAADTYPTHLDTLQFGGYRSVFNLASRNSTPNLHRKQGMLVYVQSEDKTYIFKGLIPADGAKDPVDNSDAAWPEYSPSSLPALSSGQILVGSASNTTAAVSLTGALSLDHTGNVTLTDGSVTTTILADAAVTYTKIQPIGPVSLFGNPTGAPASGSEIVLGTGLTFSGNTLNAQISSGTVSNITTGTGLTGGPITSTGTIALANGTAEGQVMVTGPAPDFSPALQTLGGDASISADGTLTLVNGSVSTTIIAATAVTYDKIQKIGALSLFGNPSNVNPATGSEITLGAGLAFTGNTLNATGTVESVSVANANGISGTVATPATTPVITLSLGAISPASVAATGLVTGSNLSGTNTGDQTIILGGDLSGSGTGSITATIANKAITYDKIQDMGASSLFGNPTANSTTGREITLGTGLNFSGNSLNLNNGTEEKQVIVSGSAPDFSLSFQTLDGDATINANGDLIIGDNKITSAKFRQSGPQTLVGNPANSQGNVSDITLGPGLSITPQSVLSLSSVHVVGESYGGGVIFYVYDGGLHGLIAATSDANNGAGIRWSGGTDTNTRARANALKAGYKNTIIIISNQGAVDGNPFAATVANEFTVPGNPAVTYADWYLPSAFELKLLVDSNAPGLNLSTNYWSSTEVSANSANFINNGTIGISAKSFSHKVRPIRAF